MRREGGRKRPQSVEKDRRSVNIDPQARERLRRRGSKGGRTTAERRAAEEAKREAAREEKRRQAEAIAARQKAEEEGRGVDPEVLEDLGY